MSPSQSVRTALPAQARLFPPTRYQGSKRRLLGWLWERLFVQVNPANLDAVLVALRVTGALDAQDRPQRERLSALVDEWGLRAWRREAQRLEEVRER